MRVPGVPARSVGMAMRIVAVRMFTGVIVAASLRVLRPARVAMVLRVHLRLLYPSSLLASRRSLPC